MIKLIKIIGRNLQEFTERHILGGLIHKTMWRFRHLYVKDWSLKSLNSVKDPHRLQISKTVASFKGVNTVLDIGCASGANTAQLRNFLPNARLTGIDINPSGIEHAKRHFASINDNNVDFLVKDLTKLTDFSGNSFDVVFTNAVLMFITPNDIDQVIKSFIRIAKRGIVLNEYHKQDLDGDFFDGGRWVYDYISLFKKHCPSAKIEIKKSVFSGGSWDKYGSLIKISL